MMRAAIYARFSTDLQNERSTEDQAALCRSYCEREGLKVVGTYQDKARSGASMLGRDGLFQLLQAAQAKKFDVIVVEALDRLSRDMEDLADIHKRMTFLGIELRAVHEGTANTMLVGLRGLVGQLYREDNVHKIRRGMTGLVKQGLSAGGKAYGYRPVPGKPGELEIAEDEAAVVRRIFKEYAEGRSIREIAFSLNRDGIAPPRGAVWNASTINGSRSRFNGILRNSLYSGKLLWNRVRMVRDPSTGKRVSRLNPESEWQRADVPELRIVDDETTAAVEARIEGRKVSTGYRPRTPRMLSGLLRCGCCGGGMTLDGQTDGKPRIRCARARESGSCDHRRKYPVQVIERAVLDALRTQLADQAALALYIDTYIAERRRLAAEAANNRGRIETALARKKAELRRITDMAIKGLIEIDHLAEVKPGLDAEIARLQEELVVAPPIKAVELHPAALAAYRRDLGALAKVIEEAARTPENAILAPLRRLVDSVIVHPTPPRSPIEIEIKGRLSALMGEELELPPSRKRLAIELVAEEGFEPPTQGL